MTFLNGTFLNNTFLDNTFFLFNISDVIKNKYISGNYYLILSSKISSYKNNVESSIDYMKGSLSTIIYSQIIDAELDLLRDFNNNVKKANESINSDSLISSSVSALNNHVLNRSNFSSLDEYFEEEGIKVDSTWANLCIENGFNISNSYIS